MQYLEGMRWAVSAYTKGWREREGVEPTDPTEGQGQTVLKTAGPTGAHPFPKTPLTNIQLHQSPLTSSLDMGPMVSSLVLYQYV